MRAAAAAAADADPTPEAPTDGRDADAPIAPAPAAEAPAEAPPAIARDEDEVPSAARDGSSCNDMRAKPRSSAAAAGWAVQRETTAKRE